MFLKTFHNYFSMVFFTLGSMILVITSQAAIVNRPTVVSNRTVFVDTSSIPGPKEHVPEIKEALADIEKSPAEKNETGTQLNLNFGLREINDALAFLGVTDNTENVQSEEMTTTATVHDISESSLLQDIDDYIAYLRMNSNTDNVLYNRVNDVTKEQIAVDKVFDESSSASADYQDNPTHFSSMGEINLKNTTSKTPVLKSLVDASEWDITLLIIVGATSSALLLLLVVVVVIVVVFCWRRSEKRKLALNKDFGRWDPQLLRPSKENINAFILGSPIPSVSEMIKS